MKKIINFISSLSLMFMGIAVLSSCDSKTNNGGESNSHTHEWGEATYAWSDDYSTCTATRVCTSDSNHKETETANSELVITKEPIEQLGEAQYVAEFSNTAFEEQTGLTYFIPIMLLNDDNDGYIARSTVGSESTLFYIPDSYNDIPVVAIGAKAFMNRKIKSINIPSSVTMIDDAAFYGSELEVINYGGTKYEWFTLQKGDNLFNNAPLTVVKCSDGDYSMEPTLNKLSFVEIESNEYEVRAASTSVDGELIIPEYYNGGRVTAIAYEAFKNCGNITSIRIPSSIGYVYRYSFNGTSNIKTVYYEGTQEQWEEVTKESYWGMFCSFTMYFADGTNHVYNF